MDNSGKTTLTQKIAQEFGIPIMGSPGPLDKTQQTNWVLTQIDRQRNDKTPPNFVYDRFTNIEELVYGNVLRGTSNFTLEDEVFRKLKLIKPLIIYTRPSRETIFNFGSREQMAGVIEKHKELLDQYDELMFNLMCSGWNVLVYDYTKSMAFKKLTYMIGKLLD